MRNVIVEKPVTPFGLEVQRLRKSRDMRQAELARRIGMNAGTLSNVEKGVKPPFPPLMRERVIQALNLTNDEIAALDRAAALSTFDFRLSPAASINEFFVAAALVRRSGHLTEWQLKMALYALEMRWEAA